ncbi:MAG: hypothetical protein ACFFAS_11855 [Promethearchaeota archaeon]
MSAWTMDEQLNTFPRDCPLDIYASSFIKAKKLDSLRSIGELEWLRKVPASVIGQRRLAR